MVVRAEVIRRKLREIDEATGLLRSWSITLERLETDRQLRWAVERGLQIAAEALFDVSAHILAAEFQDAVEEYREMPMRLLARGRAARRRRAVNRYDPRQPPPADAWLALDPDNGLLRAGEAESQNHPR